MSEKELIDLQSDLQPMSIYLFKSILHNIGVVLVGLVFVYIGTRLDLLFGIATFYSVASLVAGSVLVTIGFLLRVWATTFFYQQQMKVISLVPQKRLITSGPYRFSRNPLYLGGNVFIFFGAALVLGSPMAIALTAVNIGLVDMMIRREEKQLAQVFGGDWTRYRNTVRRWI